MAIVDLQQAVALAKADHLCIRNLAEQEKFMARTSAADLAHGLKGAKFPMSKKDLLSLARKNGVADEVLQTFEEMPEGRIWLCDGR